LPFIVKPSVLN